MAGEAARAADCKGCVDAAVAAFGRLDILFNNAEVIFVDRDVVATSEDEWDETIGATLKSIFLMSRYAIPHIAAAGGGRPGEVCPNGHVPARSTARSALASCMKQC